MIELANANLLTCWSWSCQKRIL